jgi:hypothetical protein
VLSDLKQQIARRQWLFGGRTPSVIEMVSQKIRPSLAAQKANQTRVGEFCAQIVTHKTGNLEMTERDIDQLLLKYGFRC